MLELQHKLIQGPLAGVSAAPFRLLCWQFGGLDYACTEMISAKHLISPAHDKERFLYKDPKEGKLCVQLSGNDANTLAKAVERAQSMGAHLIDLNCGCPKKKIRKKGVGTKLLSDAKHLQQLLTAMKQATDLPVTVKIRVDGDSTDENNQAVSDAIGDAQVDAAIVHGRHWTHDYTTPCFWDQVAWFKSILPCPVIANGDVKDYESWQKTLQQTQADAVMVSRAGVGKPWLFAELQAKAHGEIFLPPASHEIGQLCLQHAEGLIELEGEKPAILQMRKLVKYYARAAGIEQCYDTAKSLNTLSELQHWVETHYE